MNKCLVCDKEIAKNRKTCSHSCAAAYGNIKRGIDNLSKYSSNPNICLYCKKPIIHKTGDVLQYTQVKKFCNKSCAAHYNNRNRPLSSYVKKEISSVERKCHKCLQHFTVTRNKAGYFPKRRVCDACRVESLIHIGQRTLQDIFNTLKSYQSARSNIRKHAYDNYMKSGKSCKCKLCGYDKHIDVAHIKAVSSFQKETLVEVVNHIDNLVALCPNHHWEYDNDELSIAETEKIVL